MFANVSVLPAGYQIDDWSRQNRHALMHYLAEKSARRRTGRTPVYSSLCSVGPLVMTVDGGFLWNVVAVLVRTESL